MEKRVREYKYPGDEKRQRVSELRCKPAISSTADFIKNKNSFPTHGFVLNHYMVSVGIKLFLFSLSQD